MTYSTVILIAKLNVRRATSRIGSCHYDRGLKLQSFWQFSLPPSFTYFRLLERRFNWGMILNVAVVSCCQRLPFYVISVTTPLLLCLWHTWSFDHDGPEDSWKKFTVQLADVSIQAVMARLWFALDWSWTTISNSHPSAFEHALLSR
ncbi:uncharacterized protein BJ212DRAFT_1299768 [Suillus subaureus]|uniref:Uncharacterized protein n=1 Tax=Suillus subaureus TaxID=48587 RepID=A0A9P7JDV2_9AGAM|nr:uncharacterized protein BJ212DRAFT_1299768 [Suillus subaureus]KAG1816523.1 hypothetical protein BJ212DRAFT_1299768 [Suillus subaureus]